MFTEEQIGAALTVMNTWASQGSGGPRERMRAALEAAEAVKSEPGYQYGTRWEITGHPTREYLESSREYAEQIIKEDQDISGSPEPRGVLIRRQVAGEWEVVE